MECDHFAFRTTRLWILTWKRQHIALKTDEINTGCWQQLSHHFLQFTERLTLTGDALFLKLDKLLQTCQCFRVPLGLILKHGEEFTVFVCFGCISFHWSINSREVVLPAALWCCWSGRSCWDVSPASSHWPWAPRRPAPGWPACFWSPRSRPVARPSGSVERASVCVIPPPAPVSQQLPAAWPPSNMWRSNDTLSYLRWKRLPRLQTPWR